MHGEQSGYTFSLANYNNSPGAAIESNLDISHDVANHILGGDAHLPSSDNFSELFDNCDSEWITLNGVQGYKLTSRVNDNDIFLPADGRFVDNSVLGKNSYGYYWSRLNASDGRARALSMNSVYHNTYEALDRYFGLSIRAVRSA